MPNIYEKLSMCVDLSSLEKLENEFNNVGMTLQHTKSDKILLCKIKDNKPCIDTIFEDYMIIGYARECARKISRDTLDNVSVFVENNAGEPSKIICDGQKFDHNALFGAGSMDDKDMSVDQVLQAMNEMDKDQKKKIASDLFNALMKDI